MAASAMAGIIDETKFSDVIRAAVRKIAQCTVSVGICVSQLCRYDRQPLRSN